MLYLKGELKPGGIGRKREVKERLKDVIESVKTGLKSEKTYLGGPWDDIEKSKFV